MLVLARYPGQKIVVGKDVVIEILSVRGDKVRVGVTAPREIPVNRSELLEDDSAKTPEVKS